MFAALEIILNYLPAVRYQSGLLGYEYENQ